MSGVGVAYNLQDDAEVAALYTELVLLKFHKKVDMAADADVQTVRDMLSDIDWYKEMWEPGCQYDRLEIGVTPVAGRPRRWKTYMWRLEDIVTLVRV